MRLMSMRICIVTSKSKSDLAETPMEKRKTERRRIGGRRISRPTQMRRMLKMISKLMWGKWTPHSNSRLPKACPKATNSKRREPWLRGQI